jgi:uncharacterized protein (TIGR03435 family)
MNSLRSFSKLLLVFLWFAPAGLADAEAKVGSPAPALALKELLQAPGGIHGTWEELKGKAVVVEFWATWCGGCVENIPHINDLAAKFESRPLQFISITDETDVDLVKRFVMRHPIRGWIAFDADESTFKTYGIEGRPQTLLVDRSGVVQAISNPTSVTPEVLEDLLAGKHLNFPEVPMAMGPPLGLEPSAPSPLLQVLIRPAAPVAVSNTSPGGVVEKDGRYDAYGQTLRGILSDAYQIPENRVDAPEWCSKTMYDLSVVTPQHEEAQRWLLVKQALESAFRLKLHEEVKETPVYILRKIDGQQPKVQLAVAKEKSGYWNPRKGEVEYNVAPATTIARVAQFVLGAEVLDETELTGSYAFDLKWAPNQPASFIAAIRDQLGLELAPEQRKLNHLVVDSIEETKTW